MKINAEMILSGNVWLGLPDDLTQKTDEFRVSFVLYEPQFMRIDSAL